MRQAQVRTHVTVLLGLAMVLAMTCASAMG